MGSMADGWSLALYSFMGALYLYNEQSKITILFIYTPSVHKGDTFDVCG